MSRNPALRDLARRAGMLTFAVLLGTATAVASGARAQPAGHPASEPMVRLAEVGTPQSFPSRPLRSTPQP